MQRVLVECNSASVVLPVAPTTTPVDLIESAAKYLKEGINVNASILVESFGKVGVQRPLRRYEPVRNVMNSWDDDGQNSLILLPSATGGNDPDLRVETVKKDQPGGFGCLMHFSQKPGKWEKRWITLRPDGQMSWSKKEGHKDSTNICRLTDFDVYSPEQEALTKTIKPPKKICFAIKSQQKSSAVASTESFVHYFCTADNEVAAEWYRAVHGWRSWYLVNIMGAGKVKAPEKSAAKGDASADAAKKDAKSSANKAQRSNDDSSFGDLSISFPKWLMDNPSLITDTRKDDGSKSDV